LKGSSSGLEKDKGELTLQIQLAGFVFGVWLLRREKRLLTYSDILRGLLHPLQLVLIHDCRVCDCDSVPCLDRTQGAALRL